MATAADATTKFFEDLAKQGHEPLLEGLTATIRFDLVDGKKTKRWLVAVTKGDLAVSRQNRKADCVLRAEKGVFERLTSGQQGALAAVLRGELLLQGDPTRLVLAQRLFPGTPASAEPRARSRKTRARS
jgi:putative sterol carrier protein